MALALGMLIILLASWGTGLVFPLTGLFALIASSGFLLLGEEVILLASALAVAPVMAQFVAQIVSPLFGSTTPASFVSLLAIFFLMAILSDPQLGVLFLSVAQGAPSLNLLALGGFIAESLYVSALLGSVIVLTVALLEIPFHWFFSGKSVCTVTWAAALRPLLFIVVATGCFVELSEMIVESIARGESILFAEVARAAP